MGNSWKSLGIFYDVYCFIRAFSCACIHTDCSEAIGYLLLTPWPIIGTSLIPVGWSANTCLVWSWPRRGHYQKSGDLRDAVIHMIQQAWPERSGQHTPAPPLSLFTSAVTSSSMCCPPSLSVFSVELHWKGYLAHLEYFLTLWGCFLSVDLQPCRLSAQSASQLCLWPLQIQ